MKIRIERSQHTMAPVLVHEDKRAYIWTGESAIGVHHDGNGFKYALVTVGRYRRVHLEPQPNLAHLDGRVTSQDPAIIVEPEDYWFSISGEPVEID